MIIDEDELIKSMEKEGFSLERRVHEIFRDKNFNSHHDVKLPGSKPVDVFAYPEASNFQSNSIFVIECKGCNSSETFLALHGKSKEFKSADHGVYLNSHQGCFYRRLDQLIYRDGFYYILPDPIIYPQIMISDDSSNNTVRYCNTGDFRNKYYNKTAREDGVYKGSNQVIDSLVSLEEKICSVLSNELKGRIDFRIFPAIVTNADIYVYEDDGLCHKVDYCVYEYKNTNGGHKFDFKYIYIITEDKLEKFIKLFS